MRALERIADHIEKAGIQQVFTYMSRDVIKLLAELAKRNVSVFQTHHEHGAVGMADGFSRASGNIGVAIVGAGVGLTNCLNALVTAHKAHSRLVLFVGEVPGAAAQLPAARNVAKYIDQRALLAGLGIRHIVLQSPSDINTCFSLSETIRETIVVSLPTELQESESEQFPPTQFPDISAAAGLTDDDRRMIVELLQDGAASSRVVILAGRGAVNADARDALLRLGRLTGALMATSIMGRGLFDSSEYSVGVVGTFASGVASELCAQATLVLAFGASLNHYTTYMGDMFGRARVIHVDDKPEAFNRYHVVDIAVTGDANEVATDLANALEAADHESIGYRTENVAKQIADSCDEPFSDQSSPTELDPRTLMIALDSVLPADRNVVVDVGHFMDFPIHYVNSSGPRSFVWPIEYTAVGTSLGPALGAAVAYPNRTTVLFIGDGGAMMSLSDFRTAVRYHLNLLVVICNDSALSGELHYLRECGYDDAIARCENPSFEAIARGLGMEAATVSSVEQLRQVSTRLKATSGPMLLDCKITPEVVATFRSLLAALIRKGAA